MSIRPDPTDDMAALTNKNHHDFQARQIEYADAIRLAGRNIDDYAQGPNALVLFHVPAQSQFLGGFAKTLPKRQVVFLQWLKLGERDGQIQQASLRIIFTNHFSNWKARARRRSGFKSRW